jgi:hypothetical protein
MTTFSAGDPPQWWTYPWPPPQTYTTTYGTNNDARIAALEARLAAMEARLAVLEAK